MEKKERKVLAFDLKELDEARGTFKGYGSVFNNVDEGKDRVKPGAFDKTLKEFKEKGQLPAMFWFHNWDEPVGEWNRMVEDEKGLYVEGALWVEGNELGRKPIERSEQVRNLLTSNGPKGLSIGYGAEKYDFEDEGDIGLVRNLKEINLYEVSPVPYGMNPLATVTGAKGAWFVGELPTKRELEKLLRDAGLSQREAKALISQGWSGFIRDDEADLTEALKKLSNTVKGG